MGYYPGYEAEKSLADGREIVGVVRVVSRSDVADVRVKESKGKHIEIKLVLPYDEDVLRGFGAILGEECEIRCTSVRVADLKEFDESEGDPELFGAYPGEGEDDE